MPSLTSAEQLWVGKRQMEFMGTLKKKQCIRSSEIECSKRKEGLSPFDRTPSHKKWMSFDQIKKNNNKERNDTCLKQWQAVTDLYNETFHTGSTFDLTCIF